MGTAASQYEDTVHLSTKAKSRSAKKKAQDVDLPDDHGESKVKSQKAPKIVVDQIDPEQARQDLMAYLEIVGEHADDLPLTWRDDPELGRCVSSLTAKQYETKADAFIPCDVRVIAGTCTAYGDSNRNLPNKEVSLHHLFYHSVKKTGLWTN